MALGSNEGRDRKAKEQTIESILAAQDQAIITALALAAANHKDDPGALNRLAKSHVIGASPHTRMRAIEKRDNRIADEHLQYLYKQAEIIRCQIDRGDELDSPQRIG